MLFHSVTSSLVCYYILSYIYSQSIFLLMKYFLNKWRAAIISPYLYYLIPRLLNRFLELHIFYLFFHRYNCRFFLQIHFCRYPFQTVQCVFNPIFAMFTGHAFDLYPLLTYDIFQFFLFVLICEEPPQHPPCPLKCFVPERIPVNTRIKSTAIIISFTIFPRSFLHIYFQFIKTFIRQDIFQHTGLFF